MLQLVPQMKILVAHEPVDFRKGVDALVALCKSHLAQDPFSGSLFVFRNRRGTALKILTYDGVGFWLTLRRFSEGRIRWWPASGGEQSHPLAAQQLSVLLYNGDPERARFAPNWRQIEPATGRLTRTDCSPRDVRPLAAAVLRADSSTAANRRDLV